MISVLAAFVSLSEVAGQLISRGLILRALQQNLNRNQSVNPGTPRAADSSGQRFVVDLQKQVVQMKCKLRPDHFPAARYT